ncbi:MAG TPA: hypothetical protein PK224_03890 [Nitrospira sp.]|nr:hypothetical protein [Nitrospira sp.]
MPQPETKPTRSKKLLLVESPSEEYYAAMTPDERAEYEADPSVEDLATWRQQDQQVLALVAFGGLVPSPVADKQQKWLKSVEGRSKGAISKNKELRETEQDADEAILNYLKECPLPHGRVTKGGAGKWFYKHTLWPKSWPKASENPGKGRRRPPTFAKDKHGQPTKELIVQCPSPNVISREFLPLLEEHFKCQLYRRPTPRLSSPTKK